jgi:hypothetical protein
LAHTFWTWGFQHTDFDRFLFICFLFVFYLFFIWMRCLMVCRVFANVVIFVSLVLFGGCQPPRDGASDPQSDFRPNKEGKHLLLRLGANNLPYCYKNEERILNPCEKENCRLDLTCARFATQASCQSVRASFGSNSKLFCQSESEAPAQSSGGSR